MRNRHLVVVVAIAAGLVVAPACKKFARLAVRAEENGAERLARSTYRAESAIAAEVNAGYRMEVAIGGETAALTAHSATVHQSTPRLGDNLPRDLSSNHGTRAIVIDPAKIKEEEARERRAKRMLESGDKAAARGDVKGGAQLYADAKALAKSVEAASRIGDADGAARDIIGDLAAGKLDDLVNGLAFVGISSQELSPLVKRALLSALKPHSTEAAFQRVKRTLETTAVAADDRVVLLVHRNELVTMRDVTVDLTKPRLPLATDLSLYHVVVDDTFRVAYEGLLHHHGSNTANWHKHKHKDVRIELLEEIDQLPDVVHETTAGVFARPLVRRRDVAKAVVLVWQRDRNSQAKNRHDAR
jgi:hypothetical protein